MPYGEPYAPPPYGGGMPMSPYSSPMMMPPGGPGMGPPGGMMMPPQGGMMPPPGLGDPVGFLLPGLFKAIGGLFGGGRRPPPPPPPPTPAAPAGLPPLPELFYQNRPQFCQMFCPPGGGMMQPGAPAVRRRRRRSRLHGLGEPVGALPLLAALAPMALQILPGLIQGLTRGGGGLSGYGGYGYYGQPPQHYGCAHW